jgi:ABC-type Fe3+-siderophore transport system permease subunit
MQKAKQWLCGALVLFTIYVTFKHVWDVLTLSPELRKQIQISFFSEAVLVTILIGGILACCGFLFRRTFKPACLLQGICVIAVAALQARGGNTAAALLEIPFFLSAMMMIYLGYPFPHSTKKP